MSVFHPTEAAFSGFALIRREWKAVLAWAGLRFAVSVVLTVAIALLAADDLARFAALTAGAPEQMSDPTQLLNLFKGLEPLVLVTLPVSFLLQVVMIAALYRACLRPGERRFAYLRFGRGELVVGAVLILLWLLYMAGLFAFVFAVLIIATVAGQIDPSLAGLVAALAVVVFIGGHIWAFVRFSLVVADSFDRSTISLFHSLKLTHGHFWSLFGAYVLAFAFTVVLSLMALAAFMILAAVVALATGQGLAAVAEVFNPQAAGLAATFSAAMVAWLLFSALTGACSYPLVLGPTAEAYKAFRLREAAPPADRFHEEDGQPAPAGA